jgi:lipopolysaccharide/colanic/teichoic acid biosynthesis glycosyltransferase
MNTTDFYKEFISPYKGELEMWYQKKLSFKIDVLLIFLTVWVIVFPKSELPYTLFKDLPRRTF